MNNLKGTKTEANLMAAFAGESQARNKYTYYASKAKKEGYEQIAAIFTETANNEKEHAKIWFKLLHDGAVPDTLTNLADAAAGENYEWTDMYANMAKDAREEGFEKIAILFDMVGKIERNTKNVTWLSRAMLKTAVYLKRTARSSGSAPTAATSTKAPRLPRSAPYATIPRLTSSSWPRITNFFQHIPRIFKGPPIWRAFLSVKVDFGVDTSFKTYIIKLQM